MPSVQGEGEPSSVRIFLNIAIFYDGRTIPIAVQSLAFRWGLLFPTALSCFYLLLFTKIKNIFVFSAFFASKCDILFFQRKIFVSLRDLMYEPVPYERGLGNTPGVAPWLGSGKMTERIYKRFMRCVAVAIVRHGNPFFVVYFFWLPAADVGCAETEKVQNVI